MEAARDSFLIKLFPSNGLVAQLGEHLPCTQDVAGSIPVRSISGERTECTVSSGIAIKQD